MTYHEKLLIMSGNFAMVFYYLTLYVPNQCDLRSHYCVTTNKKKISKHFEACKEKYDNLINSTKFIEKIKNSSSCDLMWEVPKGYKKYDTESPLNCAKREFMEETNINIDNLCSGFDVNNVFETSFQDNGIIYKNVYFMVEVQYISTKHVISNKILNNLTQLVEVSGIKWMTSSEIKNLDISKNHINRMISIFAKVKQLLQSS
jgi:8-oxo-dGTP pyrophosphatase MutT (NUDIX family)